MSENNDSSNIDLNKEIEQKLSKRSRDFLSGLTGVSIYLLILLLMFLTFVTYLLLYSGLAPIQPLDKTGQIFCIMIVESSVLIYALVVFLRFMKKRELNKNNKEDNLTYDNKKISKIDNTIKILFLAFLFVGWFPIYLFCNYILQGQEEVFLGIIYSGLGRYIFKNGKDWFIPIYIFTSLIVVPLPWFYKLFKALYYKGQKEEKIERSKI